MIDVCSEAGEETGVIPIAIIGVCEDVGEYSDGKK